MYYKITNLESSIYKKLNELRTREIEIEQRNEEALKKKLVHEYGAVLGNSSQQSLWRVKRYSGFQFFEPAAICKNTWVEHKEHPGVFVPNKRTKLGREMAEFLWSGLESSFFQKVFDILGLKNPSKFTFPYMEVVNQTILLYLMDSMEPRNKDVI